MNSLTKKHAILTIIFTIGIYFVYPQELFKDGIFEGHSCSKYCYEPFVAVSKIYISKGEIDSIQFSIVDTLKKESFDADYEKHYIGKQEYIDQCQNDWKGVNLYPQVFNKTKNIDKVDAVTGATWSFNLFKSATKIALDKAKKSN
jgi:major membrane immunogen (membrane-anchored lipoprotein)